MRSCTELHYIVSTTFPTAEYTLNARINTALVLSEKIAAKHTKN